MNNIKIAQSFLDRLSLIQSKDDADYALQHMKLCRAFIIEHGISMEYLADSLELLDKQEK